MEGTIQTSALLIAASWVLTWVAIVATALAIDTPPGPALLYSLPIATAIVGSGVSCVCLAGQLMRRRWRP